MYPLLTILSAVSFIAFGIGYLVVPQMRAEFVRYGMASFRVLAAWLQIGGGLGQAVGLRFPALATAAAAGLTLMMLIAVGVRLRIGDPVLKTLPAVVYLALCGYLLWASRQR